MTSVVNDNIYRHNTYQVVRMLVQYDADGNWSILPYAAGIETIWRVPTGLRYKTGWSTDTKRGYRDLLEYAGRPMKVYTMPDLGLKLITHLEPHDRPRGIQTIRIVRSINNEIQPCVGTDGWQRMLQMAHVAVY